MAKAAPGKHRTTKFVFVLLGLLALFLIVDLLWASSSSPSSNWTVPDSTNIIVPRPVHHNISTPLKVYLNPQFYIQFRRARFTFIGESLKYHVLLFVSLQMLRTHVSP